MEPSTAAKTKRILFYITTAFLTGFLHAGSVWSQGAKQAAATGYGKASYTLADAGRFMQHWWISGPFPVTGDSVAPANAIQEQAFKADFSANLQVAEGQSLPTLRAGKDISWKLVSQRSDVINLDSIYQGRDYVYAYAVAEIRADRPATQILAVGSDDGIKIWHNGKLVHENWVPRGIEKDNDIVSLQLVKGSNQVIIKVQDIQQGWGFTARLLDKAALADQLVKASSMGTLDKVKLFINAGADVNRADKNGMAPIVAAKVGGRKEVADLLLQSGARDAAVPKAESLIDKFYSSLNEKPSPGFAVLVAKDGKVVYKKGFGYADISHKIRATPATVFRIGSVTKQFTAAAILKLQEKGLLSVQDKLSKFIPDFPRGDEVTIHQLLTHISGIHSYTGKPDFISRVVKTITPDSLIAYFRNDAYDFNPGERYQYNNSAYFLLGYIIARVSGMSYDDYLKETFFKPLQMNNTGVYYTGIKLDNEAKGYTKNSNNAFEEGLNWDMSWAGAAGAMYSTVDDLLKWNQAFHNGKVLDSESYKAAITPVVLNNGEKATPHYGYGLGMQRYRGMETIGHSGGLHGFLTQLVYYPGEKLTVVMFTNTSDPEVNFMPDKIAEAFLWNKMEAQQTYAEAAVKPANLDIYTGRFEIMNAGVMSITTEGDRLFAQLGGQQRFEIFPAAADEFFWKVVEAKIKFFRDDKGDISHAVLYQGGQEMKAQKLAEEKIVEMDPAVFDSYAGQYRMNADMTVTISREGNKFYAQATNQGRLEMFPVSDAEFVIRELNAKLKFEKNANGVSPKFTLNMNGGNTELPRVE